jgi:hypothetical protein
VNDVSGNGNNGKMFGFVGNGSERVPGMIGSALHFRGTNYGDYIQITNCNILPPTTMTIAGWVNVDTNVNYTNPTWGTIVKNWPDNTAYNQVHFGLNSTLGEDSCYVNTPAGTQIGPVTETTVMPKGQWIHVAFTADGTNMNIYRNGVPSATPVAYGGALNCNVFRNASGIANTMGIGVKLQTNGLPYTSNAGYWQGSMDDLAIWTRALTPAEIYSIYAAGEAGQPLTNAGAYATNHVIMAGPPQVLVDAIQAGFRLGNDQLYLSWPASYIGWKLQRQANAITVGLSTNWVDVAGSDTTNHVIVTVSPTNSAVFYRLTYPLSK